MYDINFFPNNIHAGNVDRYLIRKSIVKSIDESMEMFSGRLLDIGCGKMPYRKYIVNSSNVTSYVGLDIEMALEYDKEVKPDFLWNGITMPFDDGSFDCSIGTEVLEHCPDPEIVLRETSRVLKPGGVFMFTVPFLWNLHEVPHDEYRFTPFSLQRHLENSEFTDIKIQATGGWHLSMAQMIGLWLKRSNIAKVSKLKHNLLSRFSLFVMKKLIQKGEHEKVEFAEGQMITGIYGTARKA